MSRVLFVSTSTTLGGAEKTLYTLATLLDPKDYTVAGVVSLKPAGYYAEKLSSLGVKTTSLGITGRPSWSHVKELARVIRHESPDLVHAVMYQAIQLCRLAKKPSGVPFKLVSSPRVNYRSRSAWTLLVDRALKNADDLLVAECGASRDFLIGRLGYAPEKVKTIYNGVDIASWPISRLDRRQKRMELRLGAEDLLIGAVGRLDAQKGHSVLIDAVARLKGRFPVRCAIIGTGPRREALEAQVRRLHLEKNVWLLGERDDVVAWLSAFEVFVLPSLWEGLPNALLEAMALGLPVAASAVDGVPEAVTDGVTGVLVPPNKPAALAEKLASLLADRALRERLGSAAKADIAKRFGLRPMLAGYQAAYREVLAARRSK